MNNRFRASVAQIVARLVARRPTRQDEIPEIVQSVQLALTQILRRPEPEREAVIVPALAPRVRGPRPLRVPARAEVPESEPSAPLPPPRLLRRADVLPMAAHDEIPALRPTQSGILRGVVRWFDQRARRGALRLPGLSGDVPVETGLLDEMAINRLYKGQEVEATLSEELAPRVVRLVVPGGASQQNSVGGMVRGRHAKPVVVELKREALRRVAARAEAESLLGRGRNR
jgi:hypothetical protein